MSGRPEGNIKSPEPAADGGAADQELVEAARRVRAHAYAPYSRYAVGAAIRSRDGRVFAGVNVENSAYPSGLCAEHNALGSAVSAGAREFEAIAVCTELDRSGRPGSPCGKCRQVLSEFGLDLRVILAGPVGDLLVTRLADLLPRSFGSEQLP